MMFNKLYQSMLIMNIVLGVSACATQNKDNFANSSIEIKEKVYNSMGNYSNLVKLYREKLANMQDKKSSAYYSYMYKLSKAYFDKEDYESALLYIKPLIEVKDYREKALLLQLKSLVQLKQDIQALKIAQELIKINPQNADVYNSQGIAYAQLGQLAKAKDSFNKARSYFLNDTIALNNLAMVAIINEKYSEAIRLLLPLYSNGQRDQRLIYNLVFALIKAGDEKYAKQIIENENLNSNPSELIRALKNTTRVSNQVKA